MAVRLDANGDYLSRTDPGGAFTFSCWVKWKGTGGYSPVMFSAWFGGTWSGSSGRITYDPDIGGGDVVLTGTTIRDGIPSTDTWYFLCFVFDGTFGDNCIRGDFVGDGDSISLGITVSSYGSVGNSMRVGDGPVSGTWSNVSVAGAKCWTRALSASELETERYSETVVDSTNLWAYWPLSVHTDLTDAYSDKDWTGNGTLSTESDDPPWTGGGRNPVPMGFILD